MVVVLILGLVGGIAVTSWAAMMPNQQFNSAVRNLSEVLYGTRSDAIARNREFRIEYDLDKESYRVRTPFRVDGGFAPSDKDEERLYIHETLLAESGIDLRSITLDEQVFTEGKVEVFFQPLGASAQHSVELVQTQFDRVYTLEVLPLTGEIRIHDGVYKRDPVDEGSFR